VNIPETKSELERLNLQESMPNLEFIRNLMEPRHLLIPLENAFFHNQTPTSPRWEQTFELVIWYSEYRNTIAGLFHIIESHNNGTLTDSQWLWNWLKDFSHEQRTMAFRYIAKRASFLETTNDDELKKGATDWWYQQVDSYPKISSYYDLFIGFLDNCPDPKIPIIVEQLKELSLLDNMDDDDFCKGQQEIIRKKAILLLNS
jgi:hypothetical protein